MGETPETETQEAKQLPGERELARLRDAFETDLFFVFEEQAEQLGDHLRAMLFELWMKGRAQPDQKKLLNEVIAEKAPAIAKEVLETELPLILTKVLAESIDIPDYNLDTALVRKLKDLLVFDRKQFLVHEDSLSELKIQMQIAGSGFGTGAIQKLDPHDDDDDFQKVLVNRLRREALLPPENSPSWNWRPVFVHTETGRQAGVDMSNWALYDFELVQTYLTHDVGSAWKFPHPLPGADVNDAYQHHIRIEVNEYAEANSNCTWKTEWNGDQGREVVTEVQIPMASPTDVIRVSYGRRIDP